MRGFVLVKYDNADYCFALVGALPPFGTNISAALFMQ